MRFGRNILTLQGTACSRESQLFQPVIRRFAGDDHVVDVAFAQSRLGDADKFAALLKFFQSGGAAISHAAPKPADELIDETRERSLIGYLPFDAFRNAFSALCAF